MESKGKTAGSSRSRWTSGGQILLAIATLALSAQWTLALPGTDVPQTAQTLAVVLIGGLLGPLRGPLAVTLYLILGAAGLPIFADGGSGFEALTGPTAGFLFGFVAAALLVGCLVEWHNRQGSIHGRWYQLSWFTLAAICAHALILGLGWSRLAPLLGMSDAFAGGVRPFVSGGLVKSLVAGFTLTWLTRRDALETDRSETPGLEVRS